MFLVANANTFVDSLSMSFSLEIRPPFLTKDFVTFALSIPSNFKINWLQTKKIFRQAYKDTLQKRIIKMKKRGLFIPFGHLSVKGLKDYIYGNLSAINLPFINQEFVRGLLDRHYRKIEDNSYKIFTLLVLKRWCDYFLKN